jgi:hypothetical protein
MSSLFSAVAKLERETSDRFPVLWIETKNIGWALRQLRESVPTRGEGNEPTMNLDLATALKAGRIRIGNTTIKVKQ